VVVSYEQWIKPKIVYNALELLDKEIKSHKTRIKNVHLCFSTDPFMFKQEEIISLTLRIIEKLNADGIICSTLTKGIMPDLIMKVRGLLQENIFGITLVSLNEEFRKYYEPFAATSEDRIAALRRLHDNGLKTWVSIEPYPPPSIIEQDIMEILEAVSFVNKIVFGRWNYNSSVSKYKNLREHYNKLSAQVIRFCKKNNIILHIKEGTLYNN